jgi:hypothetical protein
MNRAYATGSLEVWCTMSAAINNSLVMATGVQRICRSATQAKLVPILPKFGAVCSESSNISKRN